MVTVDSSLSLFCEEEEATMVKWEIVSLVFLVTEMTKSREEISFFSMEI